MSDRSAPGQYKIDRRNDTRLATPIALMAAIMAIGVIAFALAGYPLT